MTQIIFLQIIQIIIALGLLNVWLLRFNKKTAYRGGEAKNLLEEFKAYGLPQWFAYAVGALKISIALALIAGLWMPQLVLPASSALVLLMLGALAMHIKVKDPIKKSVPALSMLFMSVLICMA